MGAKAKSSKGVLKKKGGASEDAQSSKGGKKKDDDDPVPRKVKAGKKKGGQFKDSGWGTDDLEADLACVGLRVKQVTGDGNCFFRSLGDQMEGSESGHALLRARVMDHIQENKDDYAPFVEDDEPFEKYVKRMRKDGCWAGHMELIAASKVLGVSIYVYQSGQPRWVVGDFPKLSLHISYHDGQHYNSVRAAGDDTHGVAPQPVILRAVAAVANGREREREGDEVHEWGAAEESAVARRSGCSDRSLIRSCLADTRGDVSCAVEAVVDALSARVEEEDGGKAGASKGGEAGAQGGKAGPSGGGHAEATDPGGDRADVRAGQEGGRADPEGGKAGVGGAEVGGPRRGAAPGEDADAAGSSDDSGNSDNINSNGNGNGSSNGNSNGNGNSNSNNGTEGPAGAAAALHVAAATNAPAAAVEGK
ncbi:hypothetical protein FOA52_011991 [Chlamydomonas sp. UWO 241]|nr:hypothetical protein FOA52_011991 [Chlamydomonas sp. UWO 241]